MAEPTHARTVTNAPTPVHLPAPIGTTVGLSYDVDEITELEVRLEDHLDRLNARLERAGETPLESVWDALEDLQASWPMQVTRLLLTYAVPPEYREAVGKLPPSVLGADETIVAALGNALAISFGTDPAELETSDVPTTEDPADPTVGAVGADASTG